jgi:hypothetical protein
VLLGDHPCTGPNRVERFGLAVTMRGPVMAAACAGRLRSITASPMAGAIGPGFRAVMIRIGMATGVFRFGGRFRR